MPAARYGRHRPAVDRLPRAWRTLQAPPPLAVASVNLTARKPGAAGNPHLRKLLRRHGLAPARAFAGRLDDPRYGWLDRQVIRLIMGLTGGPTDGVSTVE